MIIELTPPNVRYFSTVPLMGIVPPRCRFVWYMCSWKNSIVLLYREYCSPDSRVQSTYSYQFLEQERGDTCVRFFRLLQTSNDPKSKAKSEVSMVDSWTEYREVSAGYYIVQGSPANCVFVSSLLHTVNTRQSFVSGPSSVTTVYHVSIDCLTLQLVTSTYGCANIDFVAQGVLRVVLRLRRCAG